MIVKLEDLKDYDFYITDINVIVQKPTYKILNVEHRICNGFVYIKQGEVSWTWDGEERKFSQGSLIYLPKGSKHIFKILSDEIEFCRLEFNLCTNGEIVLFSTSPMAITDFLANEAVDVLNSLYSGIDSQNHIYKTEMLCKFLRIIQLVTVSATTKKLSPAIHYISEHFTENIDCRYLAELCYLSTSQFYTLFKNEFGVTPLEYKNNIIINRAVNMLQYGDTSVKETAQVLGFINDGYFCRFFKKHTGITPRECKFKA